MTDCIAVINAGSSSIKFAIYEATTEERCLFRDRSRGSASRRALTIADAKGGIVEDRAFPSEGFDHDAATREILSAGAALLRGAHGGRLRSPRRPRRPALRSRQ